MWTEFRRRMLWQWKKRRDRARILTLLAQYQPADAENTNRRLGSEVSDLVDDIKRRTAQANVNNLTRTQAYLDIYLRHPELQWALLAHMVSRNGGYNMTDLKGEWFIRLDETVAPNDIFAFLESSNWLIFGDAFPQLLLYEEGKRRHQNLSDLLLQFGISRFMKPIWDYFWLTDDSALLTHGLIINEQNFIEHRVVERERYRRQVLHSPEFFAQSLLGLNQVVLPYIHRDKVHITGTTVRHFASVDERILVGLRLYQMLFPGGSPSNGMLNFATSVSHTASRGDYWPKKFTMNISNFHPDSPYQLVFSHSANAHTDASSANARVRVYSPRLMDVWKNVHHEGVEPNDWFDDESMAAYLDLRVKRGRLDFEQAYLDSAKLVEQAIQSKEKLRQMEDKIK